MAGSTTALSRLKAYRTEAEVDWVQLDRRIIERSKRAHSSRAVLHEGRPAIPGPTSIWRSG
jgi:hypothetical protein